MESMMQITFLTVCHYFVFKGFSKVLICGGFTPLGLTSQCEAIDLNSNKTCQNLPNLPSTCIGAIGGLGFTGDPTICGGSQSSSGNAPSNMCYSLNNNEWKTSQNMNSARLNAAAAQLQDGRLLVTGGYDNSGNKLKTAEILTENGWESNILYLTVTITSHCMVTVDATTVMVIGGNQNNKISGNTFYFNFGDGTWTDGPALKNKRGFQSCGKIRKDKESQEMSIIVVGGDDGSSYLSSVEILDAGSQEWRAGTPLAFDIRASKMVEDQNGGVVLIGGNSKSIGYLKTLYQLPHGGQGAEWTPMVQKLQTVRYYHTAILVSDNIVDCS